VVMNKDAWNRLSPEVQKVFAEVSDQWVAKHGEAWDQADREGLSYVQELQRQIITLDAAEQQRWQTAVQPVLDEYVTAATEKGLPGREFLDDLRRLVAEHSEAAGQ